MQRIAKEKRPHNRGRLITILLLTFLLVGAALGISNKSSGARGGPAKTTQSQNIGDAGSPDIIPDHVANILMFRILSELQKTDSRRARSYARMVLGPRECVTQMQPEEVREQEENIGILLATAEKFQQEVSVFDEEAKGLKDSHWPNPSSQVLSQLENLQRRKEAMVIALAASLHGQLSATGSERLRLHVNDGIKRRVQITPGPSSPPGGPGWKSGLPNIQH